MNSLADRCFEVDGLFASRRSSAFFDNRCGRNSPQILLDAQRAGPTIADPMVKIGWRGSFSASGLHAAYAVAQQAAMVDSDLKVQIGGASHLLNEMLVEWLVNQAHAGWQLLIEMAAAIESNHELAERWLRRMRLYREGDSSRGTRLCGAISDVEAAMRLHYPKLEEQLALRGRPLQEQWLGYGRGLMAHIKRLTEPRWVVDEADCVLLQPVLGGAGYSAPLFNRILIEAVLTNPLPELPEVVRMAWLIAQLQSDLPIYSEALGPHRAQPITALAALVVALAAAEVLELSRCDEATLQLAIEHWQIAIPAGDDVQQILFPWWETYLQTRPAWPIALKALDKMLSR